MPCVVTATHLITLCTCRKWGKVSICIICLTKQKVAKLQNCSHIMQARHNCRYVEYFYILIKPHLIQTVFNNSKLITLLTLFLTRGSRALPNTIQAADSCPVPYEHKPTLASVPSCGTTIAVMDGHMTIFDKWKIWTSFACKEKILRVYCCY